MQLKLIHYVKWTLFSYAIVNLNIILLANLGTDHQTIHSFLSIFFLSIIVLLDFILHKKLGMSFDFIMIGILFVSILQILIPLINPAILGIIPSLIILVLIIFKFVRIKDMFIDFGKREILSFTLTLYFISFSLLSLSLVLKSDYLYLLIGFIPLFLMSSLLLISNFKELYKRQYLIFISVVNLIMIYLSTSLAGEYNIMFGLNFLIITLILLLHLIMIRKVCKNEIESYKIKKKKVKK